MNKQFYPVTCIPEQVRQFCCPEQYAHFPVYGEIRAASLQRQQQLAKILKHRVVPPDAVSHGVREGASEAYFLRYLLVYFSKTCRVCQGMAFQIPNSDHAYSADFVIYHCHSGLAIDCEIDEPYHLENNRVQTCHCTNDGKDRVRNQFFVDRNWMVIRLSEEQVVLYPHHCCKYIAQEIAKITGDTTALRRLRRIDDLPSKPCWNSREARHLERIHARRAYLGRYVGSAGRDRYHSKNSTLSGSG